MVVIPEAVQSRGGLSFVHPKRGRAQRTSGGLPLGFDVVFLACGLDHGRLGNGFGDRRAGVEMVEDEIHGGHSLGRTLCGAR